MSHSRLDMLNRMKVVYRKDPHSDKPTEVFWWGNFYEQGTYQCFDLFRSKAKITTFKSLKWHSIVLRYLNQEMSNDMFKDVLIYITNPLNDFITFEVSENIIDNLILQLSSYDFRITPKNKSRKIIFNDGVPLSISEKLKIVGKLIGRSKRFSEEDIYESMLYMHANGDKITVRKIASTLVCSDRTIHRNMSDQLKKEKESLNASL
jgi:hypothetical protein